MDEPGTRIGVTSYSRMGLQRLAVTAEGKGHSEPGLPFNGGLHLMVTVPCVLLQSEKLDVLSCDSAAMMATHVPLVAI